MRTLNHNFYLCEIPCRFNFHILEF
jgi:hypothetical protein